MKLTIVYGTRPEFLKVISLITYFRNLDININVIKVNQHINLTDDKGYYDNVIEIDNMCDKRVNNIGANILVKLPKHIETSTHILAQGDTATCYYALLTGFQMKKQCIHLEAGMRTYDLENPYPEEGFRQMISRITDIHLCPSIIEQNNLINEKVKGKIYVVGNTILDLVKSYNIPIICENKVLITLHRRENWDNYTELIKSIYEFIKKNKDIVFYFITHPNPILKQIVEEYMLPINNLRILEPMNHKDLITLLSKCIFVITDSGGIQEEANFLGKHIYMLRKITERNAIKKEKITIVNEDNIMAIDIIKDNQERGYEYGDGNSVEKIYNIISL